MRCLHDFKVDADVLRLPIDGNEGLSILSGLRAVVVVTLEMRGRERVRVKKMWLGRGRRNTGDESGN